GAASGKALGVRSWALRLTVRPVPGNPNPPRRPPLPDVRRRDPFRGRVRRQEPPQDEVPGGPVRPPEPAVGDHQPTPPLHRPALVGGEVHRPPPAILLR